jgi:XTP/dITP diphosphohydrolase
MEICFATNNMKKIREVKNLLGNSWALRSLEEMECFEELPENQDTLEGNSREKAHYVWKNFGVSCFADDSGLEVEALNGAPGVFSARYAGPQRSDSDNISLLLDRLQGQTMRAARFRTVITLIIDGNEWQFEGVVNGQIAHQPKGEGGFGYDPVFVPEGATRTFAEMSLEEKNQISHRARAVASLVTFLKEWK